MTHKIFNSLHARAFCHATEELSRVETSMKNAVGDLQIETARAEGLHGNPILILEGALSREKEIENFFSRLSKDDLREIVTTADRRIDEGCNLFIRLDKQAAFAGHVRLSHDEDVIAVRIRIRAFPSNRQTAANLFRGFVSRLPEV